MIDTTDFVKKLEKIINHYGLTATSFSDKVGIQRSSFSHLLSGRNKPSLDFVLKIIDVFPDVDLYWILKGIGEFPKKNKEKVVEISHLKENEISKNRQTDLFSKNSEISLEKTNNEDINIVEKNYTNEDIERICIFYTDGTFKIYKSK